MMSLFTSFDMWIFMMAFFSVALFILMMVSNFWIVSLKSFMMVSLKSFFDSLFFSVKPMNISKFFHEILFTLFVLIILVNLSSVFPYNFAYTSQMSCVFFLSLTLWVSMMSFSAANNSKGLLAHNIPEGSPLGLVPFLFLIEVISNMIRPLTLMVRLVANITAGHLLMILLSELVIHFPYTGLLYLGLNVVELGVACIQSYIFVVMSILYFSDL